MAHVVKDRVMETTASTGTGTITLTGAVAGYQDFSVIGNANTTYYTISGGTEWEVGIGTYTSSGTALSRDTVLESSNGGSLVNFSAGTKNVFVTYPAEKSVDSNGNQATGTWSISISGNAATVTNGVYTTGSYSNPSWITSIGYSKLTGTVPTWNQNTTGNAATATTSTNQSGGTVNATTGIFSGQVTGKASGVDTVASFYATTSGGSYAGMWGRRGCPFTAFGTDTGSSYKPYVNMIYQHNSGYDGLYSFGVLNEAAANAGSFNILHINSAGTAQYVWGFQGSTGNFTSPGNVTAYSDERLKKDWKDVDLDYVERLAKIKSGTYTRIDSGEKQAGVSAQDMQKLLTEVVNVGADEEKTLSLAYGNAAMVSAVELAKELVALKELVKELKSEIDYLKSK